jgi:hypothetical protein
LQIDYKNQHGLAQEALEGRGIGFAGKQVIHPTQIAPVQVGSQPRSNTAALLLLPRTCAARVQMHPWMHAAGLH